MHVLTHLDSGSVCKGLLDDRCGCWSVVSRREATVTREAEKRKFLSLRA